jgi:hypothetical protein
METGELVHDQATFCGTLRWNTEMFVVRTIENLANSVGKLVCSEKSFGFDHLALAVNPLRFDGVQPRALLRKQPTDDPYPLSALFDSARPLPLKSWMASRTVCEAHPRFSRRSSGRARLWRRRGASAIGAW